MMRMSGYRLPLAVAVAMMLLVAAAALADCSHAGKQGSAAYSWRESVATGSTYLGNTYVKGYERHSARCLFDEMRADHREIKGHLTAIEKVAPSDRAMHWGELRNVLLPHMQAEERVLYPAMQNDAVARKEGLIGEEEHAAAAAIFQKLDGGDPTSDHWMARFIVFKGAVYAHIAREEDRIFTAARHLGNDQLIAMCTSFMDQRRIAAANLPAMSVPTSMPTSVSKSPSAAVSPMCGACAGFDDLSTQNMTLVCPSCGAVAGTITPAASQCVTYEEAAMPEMPTSQTQSQTAAPAPAQQPAETPAPPMMMDEMPMGTMHCPSCGAAMGSVCPSGPSAAAQATAQPAPADGAATPTGVTTTTNGGKSKY